MVMSQSMTSYLQRLQMDAHYYLPTQHLQSQQQLRQKQQLQKQQLQQRLLLQLLLMITGLTAPSKMTCAATSLINHKKLIISSLKEPQVKFWNRKELKDLQGITLDQPAVSVTPTFNIQHQEFKLVIKPTSIANSYQNSVCRKKTKVKLGDSQLCRKLDNWSFIF